MATRLISTDTADPRLPAVVVAATQGTTSDDLAAGDTLALAMAYADTLTAAGVDFATDAETVAGTSTTTAVTPAGLAATNTVVDVRSYGAVGDGTTDDTTAIQAAIDAAPAYGGTIILPTGFYKTTDTILIDGKRIRLVGEGLQSTFIYYHGSDIAIDLVEPNSGIFDLAVHNEGDTGLKGIVVGKQHTSTVGVYRLSNLSVRGFLTAGVHVANSELGRFDDITVVGEGVTATGFLVNASRNSNGTPFGLGNTFQSCRATGCTGPGWDCNYQVTMTLLSCESWSNDGAYQAYVRGTTYQCTIRGFDLEDAGEVSPTHGLYLGGVNHYVDIMGYNLNRGIELVSTVGCFIGPSRFVTVTQTILVGASCTSNTIFDGGNLGSVGEGATNETQFIGRRGRHRYIEISGTAGGGYLDFINEQTSGPAGAANRCKVYTKDNGSGKTQLMAQFPTGAAVQIGIEP